MATIAQKKDSSLYVKAIVRLIRIGAWENLRKVVAKAHPSDLATILEHLRADERRDFLRLVFESHKLGETLLELLEGFRKDILSELEDNVIGNMLMELSSDDAVDLLEGLPKARLESVLATLPSGAYRNQLRKLLSFEPSTAGGIMQTEFLALPETETVEHAISVVKGRYSKKSVFYLYTLDEENRLSGVVSFRQLLLADLDWPLSRITNRQVVKVHVDEDQEKVATLAYRYDLLAIPVVDSKNHLVGIITIDDIMDVIEEEISEDIYKLAGSSAMELVYGGRIFKIAQVRLPWLLVSVLTGLTTAGIIGLFHHTLEKVIILASFIPVITGMAGNVGTQSTAITVRGLAMGRITIAALWETVFREVRVGFSLGIVCGTLVASIGMLWFKNPVIGVIITVSMTAGMSFAAISGSLMPIVFARFHIDPAVASGPLITTLNDCVSVSTYLGIATVMMKYML